MRVFCILAVFVCIGQFLYIFRIRKQLAEWHAFLKSLAKAPGRNSFVKGKGILADINFELNQLLEESRRQFVKLQRAEQANRQLLTDLSHDVRTPLASLIGYLESLNAGNAKDREEYLRVAYGKALDLQELTDMLFQWFRLASDEQRYERKAYDINELTREALVEHIPALEKKNISFSVNIPEDEWPVMMDQVAYGRILNNLLSNAVKHGKCSRIEVAMERHGNRVSVSVANDGIAIPEDEIPFLFGRLYKCDASRSGTGTGLGLAIVRELTEAMSGEITVTSIPGGKTTFCISLPLCL